MSTSPDPGYREIPGGFAAAPLKVISDERVESARQEARALGYSAGYAAGARAAAAEVEELKARLQQESQDQAHRNAQAINRHSQALAAAVVAADERVLPLLDDSRGLLYSLALDLASSVVGVDLGLPSAEVSGLSVGAHAALVRAMNVPNDVVITAIRMSPEDSELVRAHWDAVVNAFGGRCDCVEIISDASLARGDAISEFEDGFLDARLRTAFDRAREALSEELHAMELEREATPVSQRRSDVGAP
ncbi:hypothetical protein ACFSYH_13935 [Populibacterium corticicola]|jgi:flagellar assembly protein FliH|uniref:Flagellar assembly protein FliH/Type III secretion system HrpE domain-containing protein n=1 Tax=Populibacterium corticicola TaxID=1812826 RepID=A0ABW5XJC3_9MICO